MPTYGTRWPVYAKQWNGMTLKASRMTEINAAAKRLVDAKPRYKAVEAKTGVPWYMIAAIHERESSQSWTAQLAQGDPLNKVSTHVPRGQGPYFGADAWERAAVIALETDGLNKVRDWRLEKILYYWELYNGWGYNSHRVPSPYLWGATSVQVPGKYIGDGAWSPVAVDKQLGCAALLKGMMRLDSSIQPVRETSAGGANPPVMSTAEVVSTPVPPAKSWWRRMLGM